VDKSIEIAIFCVWNKNELLPIQHLERLKLALLNKYRITKRRFNSTVDFIARVDKTIKKKINKKHLSLSNTSHLYIYMRLHSTECLIREREHYYNARIFRSSIIDMNTINDYYGCDLSMYLLHCFPKALLQAIRCRFCI